MYKCPSHSCNKLNIQTHYQLWHVLCPLRWVIQPPLTIVIKYNLVGEWAGNYSIHPRLVPPNNTSVILWHIKTTQPFPLVPAKQFLFALLLIYLGKDERQHSPLFLLVARVGWITTQMCFGSMPGNAKSKPTIACLPSRQCKQQEK